MNTVGDIIHAVLTATTGFFWAAYFICGSIAVGCALGAEYVRTKGINRG